MFKALSSWYQRTFLPFEQPDHPLFHDQAAVEAEEADTQALWDEVLDEPHEEVRPRFKGSMLVHTRAWYAEFEPDIDFDSLPKA